MSNSTIGLLRRPATRLASSIRNDGLAGFTATSRNGVRWRYRRARRWVRLRTKSTNHDAGPTSEALSTELVPARWTEPVTPRVSVVVPTLNRSELLPVALRSIQMQDFTDWECVVVDDGSTDETVARVQRFMDADHRFRLIQHRSNRGLAASRNSGIAHANGEYVCFLDDDDFLLSGSLQARVAELDHAGPDVAGAYCDWANTDPEVQLEAFHPERKPTKRGLISFATLRTGTPFIATSPLVRSSVLLGVGGFDEDLRRGEDAELWLRILRLGFTFVDAEHLGVAYRRSPGSLVLSDPDAQLAVLTEIERRADTAAPELIGHGPLPVVEPLRDLIAEHARADQTYRYLALISLDDQRRGTEMGLRLLPAAVRHGIDPVLLTKQLTSYVRSRFVLQRGTEVLRAETAVRQLVLDLLPTTAPQWRPLVDIDEWCDERSQRVRRLGGTPALVDATSDRVADTVVLIAEAVYHIDELGPLANELRARSQRVCFMLSPKTTAATRTALGAYTAEVVPFDIDAAMGARAIVALNDWGPVQDLMIAANAHDVPTFAKVEGVQDFDDVDTGRRRYPYRTAATVLGQGDNDVRALPDKRVEVVGSTRLERMWTADPISPTETVLVNLNFTYHVLTERREQWLNTIKRAAKQIDARVVVSAHPADRTRNIGLPFADKPFRHEITRAGVLVSRFSTVPFEAMARGVPFVYHNPHREQVPTFTQPGGAFRVSHDPKSLAAAIRDMFDNREQWNRERWAEFFLNQVDVDPTRTSESRTADVILNST